MRPAVLISAALIALASGCGGDDDNGDSSQPEQRLPGAGSPEAREVAANLPAEVKEIDGGELTDVSCEPKPTQLENSKQWECRGTVDGYGDGPQPTVYTVQATPDGEITSFIVEE